MAGARRRSVVKTGKTAYITRSGTHSTDDLHDAPVFAG
jgi:hypothetical protein